MFDTIYIESSVENHPRTIEILSRFPNATRILCKRYTEIFNRKSQSFRLQKKNPALILARKSHNFVLSTPDGYGIGEDENYYFSHMLNCIYDCRYCFLQGMYRSAHYVLFVNFEDFSIAIEEKMESLKNKNAYFFSGYDCDSLALEPITKFTEFFVPLFSRHPSFSLELRTKSVQIRSLLNTDPIPNCVVAYSLNPDEIIDSVESLTPSLEKRITAIEQLQNHGWHIGLRFDPLIYHDDFRRKYSLLFEQIFKRIETEKLHSVSLGSFRLPTDYFNSLPRMYPEEKLFASPLTHQKRTTAYKQNIKDDMLSHCKQDLLHHVDESQLFLCD